MASETEQVMIRLATPDDAMVIAEQRARLFQDTGRLAPDAEWPLRTRLEPMLREMLASGEYVGWLLVAPESEIVGGAGVQLRRLLPRPETLVEREALVVNVWIAPEVRRQGHARRLMLAILAWAAAQGIERVALHPSVLGRPLYESLGFTPTNELVIYQQSEG